jgi:glycosyltransferase involved in cell wall biosynthesis
MAHPAMLNITVLIPAHNAEATIAQTLTSLAEQTFTDFKILLVNDASIDATVAIAQGFESRMQIQILDIKENLGVAGALNMGLASIDSPYIARIDADDIALPTRLEKQFLFLESNPKIDVCSTWMEMFYDDHRHENSILAKPIDDAAIKTALVQYCAMSHPASLFRKSFFDDIGVFDTRLDFAEDYDLWCRGALLGKCYANLPEALTKYRQHENQVSKMKRQLQYDRDLIIKRRYISALLGGESAGHLPEFLHFLTVFSDREIALTVLEQSMPLILKLSKRIFDERLYSEIISGAIGRHLRA